MTEPYEPKPAWLTTIITEFGEPTITALPLGMQYHRWEAGDPGDVAAEPHTRWSWVWFATMSGTFFRLHANHCIRINRYDRFFETVVLSHVRWKPDITLTTVDHATDEEMTMLLEMSEFLRREPRDELKYRSELKMWGPGR